MLLCNATDRVQKCAVPLSYFVNNVGISILVVMMLMTVMDVTLRSFFKRPILGVYEITEFGLVVVVFFAIAHTMVKKGHVAVDVLISRLQARTQERISCIVTFLGFGLFALVTWQSILFARAQWLRGLVSPALHIPIFPFVLLVAFGSALLALVLIVEFLGCLTPRRGRSLRRELCPLGLGIGLALVIVTVPIWLRQVPLEISPFAVGFIGIGFLTALLFSGMPVGFVMALVGFMGMTYLNGVASGASLFGRVPYSTTAHHAFCVLPLFILMGTFCFHSGLSRDLYYTVYRWLGNLPGGLAMATVGASAGFAAVSGSSLATTGAMGTVALPEMRRYHYDPALACGCIAAGSSLGIMIPPSIILVIYGILAEESIGKLFMAGFVPGILEAVFYIVTIYVLCKRNALMGPPGPRTNFKERFVALKDTWAVLALFILVIGGIYRGIFTPTEAAGIGAFGALLFAIGRRRMTWRSFLDSLDETGGTTAMAFMILIGSVILGYFLTITRLPFELANVVSALKVNRYVVLLVIIMVFLFLGAILSTPAVVMLTVPIFVPVVASLGFDLIWFGIIVTRVSEMGQITPPVGMNVFVMKGVAKDVPLYTIFKGVVPFLFADIAHLAMLVAFPQITLFLPNLMIGS